MARAIRWCSFLSLILAGCASNGALHVDVDGDGVATVEDCDDYNAAVWPGRAETCDGIDNNCDGQVDEGVMNTWYPDLDLDGHGDVSNGVEACSPPEGYLGRDGDCDDTRADVNVVAPELCDGRDNNCDGEIDEGALISWYYDGDGDGYGNSEVIIEACTPPEGYVGAGEDCDDGDAKTYPGASEICDHRDQDCDGVADDGVTPRWYVDADFDGYGDPDNWVEACDQVEGTVASRDDCDDTNAATYPGAIDRCDGEDNDCDSTIDEDHKSGWALISVRKGAIYEIDPTTAIYSLMTEMDDEVNATTSDVREDGLALALKNSESELFEMDVCGATSSVVGSTDPASIGGMAFGPGGILYALDSEEDNLVWVDVSDSSVTDIGAIGIDVDYSGMAYDCADDVLYAIDGNTSSLLALDVTTGAYTTKVTLHTSSGGPVLFGGVGLEYDAQRQVLWASTGSSLYQVDPATGLSTLIDNFWDGGSETLRFNDLAFHPTCP